jgi:sarcosine oxidase subunit alpha
MMDRLPYSPTQRIDREKETPFFYRGRQYKGLAGDTVATALFANGIRVFSRSLKYHRPRGLYNLDGYSTHCLMSVNGEPNVRACIKALELNMVVYPQNVIGSPELDFMSLLQWFGFAMPAGFYYKVFHRPAWIWPLAQKVLRWTAGPGKIDPNMTDGVYDHKYLHADVCVIGGGPAGMRAAVAAAKRGVRVILIERSDHLGGFLNYRRIPVNGGIPAYLYGEKLGEAVLDQENIRRLLSTTVTSIYQSNHVTAIQRGRPGDVFLQRYYEIRAKSIVVATGGIERPLIFTHNDCPGIMQGSCAQQLVHTYGLKPGNDAVLSGAHDLMLEVAADMAEAGVKVSAVTDMRKEGFDPDAVGRLERLGIKFLPGYGVAKAKQFRTLKGVDLRSSDGSKKVKVDCDVLVASAGETPLSQLLQVAGASMSYNAAVGQFLPKELPPRIWAAGRVLAQQDLQTIEVQGEVAGLSSLQDVGVDVKSDLRAAQDRLVSLPGPKPCWSGVDTSGKGAKRFVDFDEDVTVKQIEQAIEEGFDQPELIKRYTAAGTGPTQSYLTQYNLPMLVAKKRGLNTGAMLPTTIRPPVMPTGLAVLGGRKHHAVKLTPLHEQQQALGAQFRLAGAWQRPSHFGDETALDEILNVRRNVGFIDISTLGKFRVYGKDAIKLLQRVYVNDMDRVGEGRLTYAVMCNEEGVIIDDGVVTKLKEDDYFFTTSTARAAETCEWLRFHSREENWHAFPMNLTDAFAAVNLAGPRSREVLGRLTDQDVSNEAFPYMGFRRMVLCGEIQAMIARIGFVGEICYEIHVPASYGPALHRAVLEAGKSFGIKPFGLEAQSVLRLEKGHVIIVVDTDNHTTLHEIGMKKTWSQHKTDGKTVGIPALRFAEKQTHRQKLVGFMMENAAQTPPDGSIVVNDGVVRGRVCTSRYSPTLKRSIGMALVDPELVVMGGVLEIYIDGRLVKNQLPEIHTVKANVVPMPFYDPKGERLRA